ncbi:ABC transporter [Cryptosporangium minutisporangium]|uniref:Dynamin family protein n=1 Tax=Cryptosporangium minutisporangium TaxID=113569 RepID=A0ABP6T7Q3_9ACTN
MTTDGGVRALPAARAGSDADRLIAALETLRAALGEVRLELPLRGGEDAARTAGSLTNQIDDYLLPRLSRPRTPPLLVIGGSTGGGKSTLLNTLVGTPVSPAGVLRPTTRSPVLVCHPDDFGTFLVGGPLPSLPRSADGTPGTLRVLESDAVPPGLALVDAPDVDSVEAENRRLAVRLLDAADLWIFVTTAARYADAVPWELLRSAVARGASIAVVLSRVNHLAHATVSTHLRELLRAEGLGAAPLFVIEQVTLDEDGLLPDQVLRSLRMWTGRISSSPAQRLGIVRQTLTGALATVSDRVDTVADATKAQREAVATLRDHVGQVFGAAETRLRAAVEDGVLFRGDIVGRWQEYAGNGGLVAILEARAGSRSGVLTGQPSIRAARIRAGLVGGVVRLFTSIVDEATTELVAAWRKSPGGAAAVDAAGDRASADAAKNAEDAARAWLDDVDASVARADGSMRAAAMPVVVAAALEEGTLPVGREVDVAGGTVTLSAELLAEVFEDDGVRAAARTARADLLDRLGSALVAEQRRFTARLDQLEPPARLIDRLRDAARAVDRHRGVVADLFADPPTRPALPAAPSDDRPTPAQTAAAPSGPSAPAVSPLATPQPALTLDLRPATPAPVKPGTAETAGTDESPDVVDETPDSVSNSPESVDGPPKPVDEAPAAVDGAPTSGAVGTNVDPVSTDAAEPRPTGPDTGAPASSAGSADDSREVSR